MAKDSSLIICRCEEVTREEILQAIAEVLKANGRQRASVRADASPRAVTMVVRPAARIPR